LYIADTGNHCIRRYVPFGAATTFAGDGTPGFVNGNGTAARFSSPRGICRDAAGNFYVADDGNHVIRKIDPQGTVTAYAGSGVFGEANGSADQAQFRELQDLQMDPAGNLYVGSAGIIRKVDAQRNVSTFATLPDPGRVSLTITPSGKILATARSAKVYEVSATGLVTTFAGTTTGYSDGKKEKAQFTLLRGITSDTLGIICVCDDITLRKIRPDGHVLTVIFTSAGLTSVTVDSVGTAWMTETPAHRVRRAVPADWDLDRIFDSDEGSPSPFVVGVNDKLVDSDGDGLSNYAEYWSGTDPANALSRLSINSVTRNAAGETVIEWPSLQNRYYTVEYSEDLREWKTLAANVWTQLSNTKVTFTDTTVGRKQRFYRVRVPD
jgi:sugar lactone lactonase YvrE